MRPAPSIETSPALDGAALREALFAGRVFRRPAGPCARALATAVAALVEETFRDVAPPREAQFHLPVDAWLARLAVARRALASPRFLALARAVVGEVGLDGARSALDVPRLRAIAHRGHENAAAAPAYFAHRDTWYANPRAQVNLWIPLHDVTTDEGLVLYPARFGRPVPNDSASFDLERFVREVGWQRSAGAAPSSAYPSAQLPLDGEPRTIVAARFGEVILFSAAHLHAPLPHAAGRTRFSVDLRAVDLDDVAADRGAPDPDNASRGSTLGDYLRERA